MTSIMIFSYSGWLLTFGININTPTNKSDAVSYSWEPVAFPSFHLCKSPYIKYK